MRLVEVEWVDSMMLNYGEWGDREDHEAAFDAMTHRSCGYLFSENDKGIILALTVYEQEGDLPARAAGAMLIPRGAILSTKDLLPSREEAGVYRTAKEIHT